MELLRELNLMGEGIPDAVLFLAATSLTTLMRPGLGCQAVSVFYLLRCQDAPWLRFRLGQGVSTTPAPQRCRKRSAAKRSVSNAQQLKRSTPTAGRVSKDRGTNVKPRPPDWTEDGGLEHSAGSARAASGEQSQIRSGSIPSWATLPESESNPSGHARATGTVPPRFLWRETSEKPDNVFSITHLHADLPDPAGAITQIVHSSS